MINMSNQSMTENSPTVTINSIVQKKISSGIKIFNFSAGEPELAMHELLLQAVIEAMNQGKTLYPPVSGIHELKCLATEWMNNSYHCQYKPDNCLVVNGGKLGIYLLLQHLLKKGDEVIIVSPYWVSYPAIVRLFGGTNIVVETQRSEDWKLTPDKLRNACSANTRMLILNNASNPTGTLYSRKELQEILNIAKEHDVLVVSDEVYSGLVYDGNSYISCGSFNDHTDNVIVIQSCSKNFSMTGWRVGFVFANEQLISPLTSLLSQSTSGVTTVSQWAAIAAFKHEKIINSWVQQEMKKRRDAMIKALNTKFGIEIDPPASSLYLFISLDELGVKNISSAEFCADVLENVNVALVPGSAFGKEGYIRLSFGTNENDIIAGIGILAQYLQGK